MARKHNELIAREGWIFFVPAVVLTLVLFVLGLHPAWWIVTAVLAFYIAWFFRNPYRKIPDDPQGIVSPADGKVVGVHTLDDGRKLITIFLNIFNVHVNRVPIAGRVTEVTYTPGKFLAAYKPEASEINERNKVIVSDGDFHVEVVQIAGLIARRIICWVSPEEQMGKGQRFGLIRFGSRMDVILPASCTPTVSVGEKVVGGSQIIARRNA